MYWGILLHLSYNMWEDGDCPVAPHRGYSPVLRFDDVLWRELVDRFWAAGGNTLVLDLGDGVQYRSRPEIAVRGAWTVERLKNEVAELAARGIRAIPKLNFSTAHDTWLGPYSRCVSTPTYYQVCRDLIAEVVDLFGGPPLFHIGMDEEAAEYQKHYSMVVVRQHQLWWHDLEFLIEAVRSAGSRPWVWSDQYWRQPEAFLEKMSRHVVQSNWHYRRSFDLEQMPVRAYQALETGGFDQMPTGSHYLAPDNLLRTAAFCRKRISRDRLLGFLQTPWKPTLQAFRSHHLNALAALEQTIRAWNGIGSA